MSDLKLAKNLAKKAALVEEKLHMHKSMTLP
jgi:hypothetical protein